MDREKIHQMLKSPAMADLWRWSKGSRRSVFEICILNLIVSVSSLVIIVSTKGIIDGATAHVKSQLLFYAILLTLAILLGRIASLLSGLLSVRTGGVLLKDIRGMFLEKLLKKQYASVNQYHSGELVNRMFSDINVVRNGILEIVPNLVSMAAGFFGAAMILISIDFRLVIVLVAGGAFGSFLLVVFRNPMKSRHKGVQEAEGRLHAILQETLENLRTVKASVSEERIKRRVEQRQEQYLQAQLKKGFFSSYVNGGIYLVFQMSWLFCMLWGCHGIYEGRLTYGMLAAIIQLVGQIQGPITSAAGIVGQIYGVVSSAERLTEILNLPGEAECEPADAGVWYRQFVEIQMENMDFSYGRGEKPVLEQVNCRIRSGDFVAITGSSGQGKSTLFQLLLGLYEPCGGKVAFRFQNDRKEQREVLACGKTRTLFAYVPQGNTLFSGTLRENFSMFTDGVTDEEIWQTARLTCMDSFLEELEDGLDTIIGERGIGLSEGQAQRVAIARALLSKAPILLLDESTSALDEKTEAKLLRNISSLKEKTCLIVTHRMAALQICDYRLHMEDGKIRIHSLSDTKNR